MTTLSRRALSRSTLARQMLLGRERITAPAAVDRLAGMQAQVPKPPFVGLWSRIEGFRRDELRGALESNDVVRATMMRGTIHLVTRRSFLAWRGVIQPVLELGEKSITKRGGPLDVDRVAAEARKFFAKKPATFEELRRHLAPRFPDANERLLGYAARMHVPLVMVPDGSRWSYPPDSLFTLAESRLGRPIASKPGADDFVLAYLAAFGPASVADFQSWSGLKGARALFEKLRTRLQVFRDESGRELFDVTEAPRPGEAVAAPVRFLPEYDNLLLAHADRTRIIADEHRPLVVTKNLRVLATFLVDGFVAGTWSVRRKTRSAVMEIEPFRKLAARVRDELVAEGERLLEFVEEDAATRSVSVSPAR